MSYTITSLIRSSSRRLKVSRSSVRGPSWGVVGYAAANSGAASAAITAFGL
jgi:hypothetical protein